jgi:hypothetical protein
MEMLVGGKPLRLYQVGAVATRAERRGEGLSKRILEFVFDQHPQELFFLFANDNVLTFYPRFGFKRVQEHRPVLFLKEGLPRLSRQTLAAKKISVQDPAVSDYLNNRACFSNILDCTNAAPVNWFHLLLEYPGSIYEIPALQALLIAEQQGSTLAIHDIVAKSPVTFEAISAYLSFTDVHTIRFGFNPDWLIDKIDWVDEEEADSTLFIRGDLHLPDCFVFPTMIRT